MITVLILLAVCALGLAVASAATNRAPLWAAVVLLAIIELLRVLPLGR